MTGYIHKLRQWLILNNYIERDILVTVRLQILQLSSRTEEHLEAFLRKHK